MVEKQNDEGDYYYYYYKNVEQYVPSAKEFNLSKSYPGTEVRL